MTVLSPPTSDQRLSRVCVNDATLSRSRQKRRREEKTQRGNMSLMTDDSNQKIFGEDHFLNVLKSMPLLESCEQRGGKTNNGERKRSLRAGARRWRRLRHGIEEERSYRRSNVHLAEGGGLYGKKRLARPDGWMDGRTDPLQQ